MAKTDLSERDIKTHRTVHHPDWCVITDDDCWGVTGGNVEQDGRSYCIYCDFYKEKTDGIKP